MATKSAPRTKKAEKNNDQLFPLFLKNLSSDDISEFATAALKLTNWLKVDKAYYPKARPKIIDCIETAHETVRRHSGYPDLPYHHSRCTEAVGPWAEPFTRLLRTVIPFYLFFSEISLQSRLRILIQTLCENVDEFLSQQPLVQTRSASGSDAGSASTWTTETSGTNPTSGIAIQSPAVQQGAPVVSAETSNPLRASRPKAKKRRISLDDDFIEADLNWFKDKHPNQPLQATHPEPGTSPQEEKTPMSATVNPITLISNGATPVPTEFPEHPLAEPSTPGPTVAEPKMLNGEDDSKPTDVDTSTRSPPRSPTILGLPLKRRRSPEVEETTDTDITASKPIMDLPRPTDSLPSPLTVKKKKRRKGPPGLKFLPLLSEETKSGGEGGSTVTPASDPIGTSREPSTSKSKSPLSNSQPPLGPTPSEPLTTEPSTPAPAPEPVSVLIPPPAAVFEETTTIVTSPDAIEIDVPSSTDISVQKLVEEEFEPEGGGVRTEDVEMRPPSQPRDEQPCIPTTQEPTATNSAPKEDATIVHESLAEKDIESGSQIALAPLSHARRSGSPIRSAEAAPPLATVTEQQDDPMDAQSSPYESRTIRLLNLARGAPSFTPAQRPVELHFQLSDDEVAEVMRWNDRSQNAGDLSASMSVSLVSYRLSQCTAASSEPNAEELDIATLGYPSFWPDDGSLYVALNVSGDRGEPQSFSVSAPFGIALPDRAVDLGARGVCPGKNSLQLFQYHDHSDRLFAVVLHRPTAAQLAELQAARDRQRAWEDFLGGLGTFNLATPRLVLPPTVNAMRNRCNM